MRLLVMLLAVVGTTSCSSLAPRHDAPASPPSAAVPSAESEPTERKATEHAGPSKILWAAGSGPAPSSPVPSQGEVSDTEADAPLFGPATVAETEAPQAERPQGAAPQAEAPGSRAAPEPPPAPPQDLWQRVRGGFALSDYDHPRVEIHRQWYVDHPDYIHRLTERAEPFLHMIVGEVERRGMPTEIALLPVVESAFQPFAYSHGRAAGIWQFIPGTGRRYGLKQNWWYDGRRDVAASTRAALDYLEDLHAEFNGDWLLALAAYNSGEGTVHRAIRRNRRKGMPTDFWYLDLPRETEGYPPKLLAISAIVADPAKYSIQLRSIENAPQVAEVDAGAQIDLARVAELADMELEQVYRLNPGFNRWATPPNGPHNLLVPLEKKGRLEKRLAALSDTQRVRWERHKIRRGDSLIRIARRYRTTVGMLRKVNRLRGSRIVAGKHLLIPVATRSLSAYTLSAEQRRKALQERERDGRSKLVHTVRRGDTLWELARRYRVSVRKLAKWNGMATRDFLKPGQKLVIWVRADRKPADLTRLHRAIPVDSVIRPLRYIVRRGDSLARIARRFRVTVNQLRKWNSLPSRGYLQPGQRLTLYVDVTRQAGG